MSALFSPPIELYDETIEVSDMKADEHRPADDVRRTSPRDNGEVDRPAFEAGGERLNAVLGW